MSREWLGEMNNIVIVPFPNFTNISEGTWKGLAVST